MIAELPVDLEYIVEVKDFRGILLDHLEFEDSNTAYHEYRTLSDQYRDNPDIRVVLIEPDL
jgi:hypothetical protein